MYFYELFKIRVAIAWHWINSRARINDFLSAMKFQLADDSFT